MPTPLTSAPPDVNQHPRPDGNPTGVDRPEASGADQGAINSEASGVNQGDIHSKVPDVDRMEAPEAEANTHSVTNDHSQTEGRPQRTKKVPEYLQLC